MAHGQVGGQFQGQGARVMAHGLVAGLFQDRVQSSHIEQVPGFHAPPCAGSELLPGYQVRVGFFTKTAQPVLRMPRPCCHSVFSTPPRGAPGVARRLRVGSFRGRVGGALESWGSSHPHPVCPVCSLSWKISD